MKFLHLTLALSFALLAGCSTADVEPSADQNDELTGQLRGHSDAQIEADIVAAAEGLYYMSEGDFPFRFVSAKLPSGTGSITESLVRDAFASTVDGDPETDKPMTSLYGQETSWAEFQDFAVTCDGDDESACSQRRRALTQALERNLRDIKVFYFGSHGRPGWVDGVRVSIFVVGRTPQGTLAGVRTIATWT